MSRASTAQSGVRRTGRPPVDALVFILAAAWVVGFGLWTVLGENRPTGHDSVFPTAYRGFRLLLGAPIDGETWARWIGAMDIHPPLPMLLGLVSGALFGMSLAAVRLGSVALHLVLLVQVYTLVRRLTGHRDAVALACWLVAVVPLVGAWMRCDYPEPLLSVLVIGTLQLAMRTSLHRPAQALLLGVVVGLGALTKLGYAVIMLPAAVLFVGAQVRRRRAQGASVGALGVGLVLAVAGAMAVAGWWYLWHIDDIITNFHMSTQVSMPLSERLARYFWQPTGNLLLVGVALAGLVLARVRRTVPDRDLALVAGTWLGGYAALTLLFDVMPRYIGPLHPLSCVLAALLFDAVTRGRSRKGPTRNKPISEGVEPPRWQGATTKEYCCILRSRNVAGGDGSAAGASVCCVAGPKMRAATLAAVGVAAAMGGLWAQLSPPSDRLTHGNSTGWLAPDRRDFGAFARARRLALTHGPYHVLVVRSESAMFWISDLQFAVLNRLPGPLPSVDWTTLRDRVVAGEPVAVVVIDDRTEANPEANLPLRHVELAQIRQWFDVQDKRRLGRFTDNSAFGFTVYRVDRPTTAHLERPPHDEEVDDRMPRQEHN